MDFGIGKLINALLIIIIVLIFIITLSFFMASANYKRGQIDALSGKAKYELQTQSDSTRIWVEKEDK